MNTTPESPESQTVAAFSPSPASNRRYHEYTFGKRNIHWDKWLHEDDARDVVADNSEEQVLPEGDEEYVPELENEGASEASGEAEPSDASSSDDNDDDDEDSKGSHDDTEHHDGKPITEQAMTLAKRLAVLKYPGDQFIQLPQFKRYLAELSKEDMVSSLRRDWDLEEAVATRTKVVTTFHFTHPSRSKQRIIERACGGSLEERGEAVFDMVQALRAKDVESLRRLVRDAFSKRAGDTILAEMFPEGAIHDAFLAELYGSAIVVGGPKGKGYGLECEDRDELEI